MTMRPMLRMLLILLCLCPFARAQQLPPLNANDWNFVLVQPFETPPSATNSNNLSVTGLNHALRFAQLLNTATAGKQPQIQQVYAFTDASNPGNMAVLQSIQPYALLNNLGVKQLALNPGDVTVYNSPAYFVRQILANQARGTYIMAMPVPMMQALVSELTGSTISLDGLQNYLTVSGNGSQFMASIYQDGIQPDAAYPRIPLPARSACPQQPVTVKAPPPAGLHAYTDQKVYLVRHVEAHPTGNFENGNYVCQGQWRALGANDILMDKMDKRRPDYVLSSDPANIIDCGEACPYIRPSMTVAPFAIQHGLPLTLAKFQWQDATDLAEALFNRDSPYFQHPAKGSAILVGWEHDHIVKAVNYLLGTLYRNPGAAAQIPDWNFDDYDTIWELSTDKTGALTFRNSCEGIPSTRLPSSCPAFFQ